MKQALLITIACIAGCGGDPECGIEGVDTASDPQHCGACHQACAPAADCGDGACRCPASFLPANPAFLQTLVRDDIAQLPGLHTGIGVIQDGEVLHGILVGYEPARIPVGTDIDLASAPIDVLRVGFGYQVDPLMNIRGTFLATGGTLRVTAACKEGISGELANVTAIEVDLFADLAPIAGGCMLIQPALAFSIGEPCMEAR